MGTPSFSKLAKTEIKLKRPSLPSRRRSGGGQVVGLDLQPGEVVAAQVRVNGRLIVERAVAGELMPTMVREGEVTDPDALGAHLKSFFAEHGLANRVRVGLASQRVVMRTIDLPPMEDAKDIAAAVRMHAPDHIAMPLDQAVIDHQLLGLVDTPDGRRARVVVVAARREPVEQLLAALRRAGLRPEGIDVAGFALVRALHGSIEAGAAEPVLYVHVGGVTTLAIARGTDCELTRLASVDLEVMAGRLAERDGISIMDARHRLTDFGAEGGPVDERALEVLDVGLAELADDLRNTIEFHANPLDGAHVGQVVISGPASLIPNFPEVLEQRLGLPVRMGAPAEEPATLEAVPAARVAVAAGLAVEEIRA